MSKVDVDFKAVAHGENNPLERYLAPHNPSILLRLMRPFPSTLGSDVNVLRLL